MTPRIEEQINRLLQRVAQCFVGRVVYGFRIDFQLPRADNGRGQRENLSPLAKTFIITLTFINIDAFCTNIHEISHQFSIEIFKISILKLIIMNIDAFRTKFDEISNQFSIEISKILILK